jgi:hypothetical protein
MSGEGNDNAVRELKYFIASVYRPATIETMLSGINKTLCGIYCLLNRRNRLTNCGEKPSIPYVTRKCSGSLHQAETCLEGRNFNNSVKK